MNRKSKTLGLAVFAPLAISAVATSPAQAGLGELHIGAAPGVLTAQAQTEQHVLTLGANVIKCTNATFEGRTTAKTVSEWTVTPTFSGCKSGKSVAHIQMNGCKYTFTGGSSSMTANIDIAGCTKNKVMEIEVTSEKKCVITVGEQTAISHVTFENFAGPPQHMVTKFTLAGIHYVEDGEGCPDGDETTGNNGQLNGKTTVNAYQLKTEVERTLHSHIYMEYVCGPQVDGSAT